MIGENCHRNDENRLAKHYLALSCKAFPTSSAYNLLASIYNQEGKKATARALWKKAMEKASLTDKTDILGTSYGALRTTRSRIKGKLKDKEQ